MGRRSPQGAELPRQRIQTFENVVPKGLSSRVRLRQILLHWLDARNCAGHLRCGFLPTARPVAARYDTWTVDIGYPAANHYIVTRHYDKPKSITPCSLITVLKTGMHGRPFQLRHRVRLDRFANEDAKAFKKRQDAAQAREQPFFDQVVPPGSAIIMTLEANLLSQHAVPAVPEAGPSGSLVFRTITERVFGVAGAAPKRRRVR